VSVQQARRYLAEVIVDVNARETDRAYHYAIPEEWRERVFIGMRVLVPFGPRRVEGYIVSFAQESETPADKIRPILRLLDDYPALTPELIELSEWLCERYLCTRAQAVQALLPGGMRLRSTLVLEASGKIPQALDRQEREILAYLDHQGPQVKTELLNHHPSWRRPLARLLEKGAVRERYVEQTGVKEKRVTYAVLKMDKETLLEKLDRLQANAFKQKEVALWLLQHGGSARLRDLLAATKASRSTVAALRQRGILELEQREERRNPYEGRFSGEREKKLVLTPAQARAYSAIMDMLKTRQAHTALLQGVTGSGKTEVYLQAIEACVQTGRQAIVLVPEIALTPQMVERFKRRFGDEVAVLHSRLSPGERYDEWRRIRRGEVGIAVGARSAVFAPFERLGLIIIDEEHELSYKQEENPKYHAREVAYFRALYHGATVVLGSATPSLEVRFAAAKGRISHIVLPERVNQRALPPVEIVDMRAELRQGNRSIFSRRLYEAITEKLARREQMILFLNRRGYATFILCRACGYVARCPSCDVSLTYHYLNSLPILRCHYCGHAEEAVGRCPECGSPHIRNFGTGTQKVEEELLRQFPGARVIRMDVDTTATKGSHERLLRSFGRREGDILLGTQMIAKGLDFPGVTLVGILTADTSLNLPDFRAAERTFQLLTQVAGRVGRHEAPGEVILQTYHPEHYAIQDAVVQDYERFFQKEIQIRRSLDYPPFWEMTVFTAAHELQEEAFRLAKETERWLRRSFADDPDVIIHEATAAPLSRLQGRYRFHQVIKYKSYRKVKKELLAAYLHARAKARKVDGMLTVDVNAQMVL
jgi:primosomal protein N' (replication factor Y)